MKRKDNTQVATIKFQFDPTFTSLVEIIDRINEYASETELIELDFLEPATAEGNLGFGRLMFSPMESH